MWVDPGSHGLGVGRRVLDSLEELARENGVRMLHLETNRALEEAMGLYCAAALEEVAPFNDKPHAHHWFDRPRALDVGAHQCPQRGPQVEWESMGALDAVHAAAPRASEHVALHACRREASFITSAVRAALSLILMLTTTPQGSRAHSKLVGQSVAPRSSRVT